MAYTLDGLTIRNPDRGWTAGYERIGGTHTLLSGARVIDTLGFTRTFGLAWSLLTDAEYAVLEGRFLTGESMVLTLDDGTTTTVLFDSLSKTVRVKGTVDAAAVLLEQ